jgi:hypothetical protein
VNGATFKRNRGGKQLAKMIEFYLRGTVPKKVKPVPIEQRGNLLEFPEEQFAAQSKTEDITERFEVRPSTVVFFGCFKGINERDHGNGIRSPQDVMYCDQPVWLLRFPPVGQQTAPTADSPGIGTRGGRVRLAVD